MAFIKNCWYAAVWLADLPERAPFGRIVAGERMVFWRIGEDKVAALTDACPHRKAPLSLGVVQDGQVACRYHGLGFAPDGKCVTNPHGPLQESLAIRAYPVEVRDGMVWVWTGRADKADPALIPEEVLAFTRTLPVTAYVTGYLHARAGHKLFEDNLLDPGHADFLHPFLGGGAMTRATRTFVKSENSLRLTMIKDAWAYPPMFRPGMRDPDDVADNWAEVLWNPNGAVLIRIGATSVGRPREQGVITWTAHIFTPESETTTHYLYASGRNYNMDDADYNAALAIGLRASFVNEDVAMLEGQQAVLGDADLLDTKPHLFPMDNASVQARRLFDSLVAADQADWMVPN